ncbi:rai1 protein [Xylona heveae TC161]|uniref:Decapping nuclease n=1 Tax=Xylona heveae (strain CBS 132557 / TC161) TaxID=1328760 RepID=A0A165FRW0_XYLHT|nr:rai1 protein [Xylona heveae TC161]KZF21301.1 rai1 protein [Xylona heveae TC161]
MSIFDVQPVNRFAGSSAAIRRPKEIAHFSYDDDHVFRLDDSSLRYYYPPSMGADLSKGYESFKKLDDTADDHLDSLLKTILESEKETGSKCEADFITWRGMMTKIMATPFDNFNGFEMNATFFQGTIFIEENHEYKLAQWQMQKSQPPRRGGPSQDLMSFWGYKFETISLLPDTWDATSREYIESREDEIVNNHAQYCSVVRTGIGKSRLVIGGEVDAVWDKKPENKDEPINWVELKTSEEIYSDRDMQKFERKLLKFWIQSFLLGVPKIIVGFRNRNGILQRLEELETRDIPINVKKRGMRSWDGNLCINFTASFLEWLKQTIQSDGVWRIRRKEKSPVIEVFKLEDSGYGSILSPEFVQWRNQFS